MQKVKKPDLLPGYSPIVRKSKPPMEILDRERIGIMERQPTELRRHRKRDLDEIVQGGFTGHVAQAADIVGLERPQRSETKEYRPER